MYNRKEKDCMEKGKIYIMIGKNNYKLHLEKDGEKVTRYSIKKFTVGTASVAVAASIFFGMGSVAHAAEVTEETSTNKIEVKQDNNSTLGNNQNTQQNNSKPAVTEQPTSKETTNKEVANKEVTEKEVADKETVNKELTNQETTGKEVSEKEVASEENVNTEIPNKKRGRKSLASEESSNKESANTPEVAKKEETNKNVESNQEATEEVDKVMLEVAVKEATELQNAENVDEKVKIL